MKTLVRISLRNGLVAGVLSAILIVALYYIGKNPLLIAPFLDFRIFVFGVFIFFALKEFRDYHQGGVLYFWQGLIGGFIVVTFASLLSCLGLYIFGKFEPALMTSFIEGMTTYLKTFPKEDIERIGKDIYERNLSDLPSTNLLDVVKKHYVQGMFIGFFISVIISVIVRKIT